MYFENRGQHPSLNTFYQIVTLLDISVDQFFYPDRQNGESDCRQHIDRLLNTMDEKELTVILLCFVMIRLLRWLLCCLCAVLLLVADR